MNQQLIYIIVAFGLSAACGVVTIPQIIRFCNRRNLYDRTDSRKIHKNAIPRLGGICFLPSMLLALFVAVTLHNHASGGSQLQFSLWSVYFFISLILVYATGLVDDLTGIGPKTKFTVQLIAAALLPMAGLYINDLYGLCGIHAIPYTVGMPLTVLVIVFIVNAINLIDGIDGLSASVSFMALAGFLYCFMQADKEVYCVLIAAMMGVLLPFFHYNVFGSEARRQKIFMGDSGSLTLGLILAFLLVKVMMRNPEVYTFSPQAVLLAYTLLIVPAFDVIRVSLQRLKHHQPVFGADKNHIHHKLLRAGLSQHQALASIVGLTVLMVVLNMTLRHFTSLTVIVGVDILAWLLFHHLVNRAITKRDGLAFIKTERHDKA